MVYPTDADFAEARSHRAPPQRDVVADIVDVAAQPLTFDDLRAANLRRLPQFKNAKGEPAHSQPDGSDWSDSDWLMAVTGELGEFANLRKKVLRGDVPMAEAHTQLAHELADVVTYLDILAFRMGIDLGAAVREKFNVVSARVGADVKL